MRITGNVGGLVPSIRISIEHSGRRDLYSGRILRKTLMPNAIDYLICIASSRTVRQRIGWARIGGSNGSEVGLRPAAQMNERNMHWLSLVSFLCTVTDVTEVQVATFALSASSGQLVGSEYLCSEYFGFAAIAVLAAMQLRLNAATRTIWIILVGLIKIIRPTTTQYVILHHSE